jgi:branched-chain amino acid transport system permease protein
MTAAPHRHTEWMRPVAIAASVAGALCAAVPFASDYALHVLITSMYYTMLAASWNLLAGFTGQFSLAHQAFAAIGAYTSGLLMVRYGFPMWASIACGITAAGVLGLALGRLVLRMRAIYLAIATWAFAETVHIVLTAGYAITRGELGLNVPPLFADLDVRSYYYLFIALTLAMLAAMYAIVCSRLGIFMRAIRDDELRAATLGVNTTRIKVLAFTITSAFAGSAGAFYAHYGRAQPADRRLQRDGESHHHGGGRRPRLLRRAADRGSADSYQSAETMTLAGILESAAS